MNHTNHPIVKALEEALLRIKTAPELASAPPQCIELALRHECMFILMCKMPGRYRREEHVYANHRFF